MRRAARIDSTARALIAAARDIGAHYAPADGTFDGVLWVPWTGQLELIDFKSPRSVHKQSKASAGLTQRQTALVEQGWPIRFVADETTLRRLLRC